MPGNSGSKNIYCSNSSQPYTMSVSWSESSPSIPNNTSVISANGSLGASNVSWSSYYNSYLKLYWHDDATNSDTLFATSAGFLSCGMGYGTRSVSGSITVTHKADGSASGYVWMRFEAGSTSGGWSPGTDWVGTPSTSLTTIARASSFTINAGNSLLGSPVSITIDRKSSSFTHRVSYQFSGSSSTTVSTNASTSASFTPPISLASQIPNSVIGTLTISVTTWNGSTQIGSAVNKSVDLGVPSSVVPTMSAPTATRDNNGVPSSWGVYVQSFSKCTVKINNAAGKYGSTIKSYQITGGGVNSSSSSVNTGVLTQSGTITFTCTITDSRGRTASDTVSINVLAYSPPSIAVSAERCTSNGTISSDGTYLRVTADYSYASVSGKNYISSKSVTCNGNTNTTFGDGVAFTLAANVSIGSTYILTAKVTDALGRSAEANIDIRTSTRIMNVRKDKKGLAIGKFSEQAGFEVGWPSFFEDNVEFQEQVKFRNGTWVHSAIGTQGSSGVVKIARIRITSGNINSPIKMVINQRGRRSPATLYIVFNSISTTDPTLNNSMFTFEGDDDYSIYIMKSATSTWDLYVLKSESYDAISILEYSTDIGYMGNKIDISWLDEQVSGLPLGVQKATNLNNLTRYNASGIDPNTTLYPLILTNHANRPSTVSAYWYIQTFFYSQKSATSNRYQIAMPYSTDKESIYHRFYHDSTNSWSKWRKLVSDDDTGWVDIAVSGNTAWVKYRKKGGVVYVRGASYGIWSVSPGGTRVFNNLLPADCRPPMEIMIAASSMDTTGYMFQAAANEKGEVFVTNLHPSNSRSYWNFSLTFPV